MSQRVIRPQPIEISFPWPFKRIRGSTMSHQKGDVVQLKSGGPAMTITDIVNGNPHCAWFHENTLLAGIFTQEALQKVTPIDPTNTARMYAQKK
jgi:uncharacterized protein YodC (DUF2158 family)